MDVIAQIAAAFLVIALLGFLWWTSGKSVTAGLGKFRISSRNLPFDEHAPRVTVHSRSALTPTHHVHLVQVMDRLLLISTYPNGSSVIFEKPFTQGEAGKPAQAGQ